MHDYEDSKGESQQEIEGAEEVVGSWRGVVCCDGVSIAINDYQLLLTNENIPVLIDRALRRDEREE